MQDNDFHIFYSKFNNIVKELGGKYSINREYILKIMFFCKNYLDVKNIKLKLQEDFKIKITLNTIYNILSFLEEMKLLDVLIEPNSKTKFYRLNYNKHNGNLICTKCAKIVCFYDKTIIDRQNNICHNNGFSPLTHTIILYGTCKECNNA